MQQPPRIRGVLAPVITPFTHDLRPEPARFIAHCRWLLGQNCGLAVFGTNSEANSLSVDERIALLDALLAADLDPAHMMPGTGCCSLTDSVRLTDHAVKAGCAGVLMLPPFYYKDVTEDGLYRHFAEVVERVGDARLRIYLYHIPPVAVVGITPQLVERLMQRYSSAIAGMKDSSGDWNNTRLLIERFPDLAIFPGAETLLLPALQAGGAGCISASCNVNTRQIRKLYDRFRAGERDLAEQQEELNDVRKVLQLRPMIPVMKHLIADERSDPAWRSVRPPLLPLPDVEARALESELSALGWRMGEA
jgi:4-hydroxy-tetrahydrodipicolinate synthase